MGKKVPQKRWLMGRGFLRKDIAKVAGVSGGLIRDYVDRGWLIPGEKVAIGRGNKHLFSQRNVFEVLLIRKFIGYGMGMRFLAPILHDVSDYYGNMLHCISDGHTVILSLAFRLDKPGVRWSWGFGSMEPEDFHLSLLSLVELNEVDLFSVLRIDITDILRTTEEFGG